MKLNEAEFEKIFELWKAKVHSTDPDIQESECRRMIQLAQDSLRLV